MQLLHSSRLAAFALFTAFSVSAQAAPAPASAAPPAAVVGGAEFVKNLTALIASEYIYKTPPEKLFDGAINGMEGALKEKKLPAMKLPHVAPKADFDAAAQRFAADFYQVAQKHPRLMTDQALQVAAVRGMLKTLEDPYTVYMNDKEFKSLQEAMNGGNFGGLGIYIELDKENANALTVIEPMEDTPAMRAGVRARDVITAVDGKPTANLAIPAVQALLRGEVGSKVTLTLKRGNQPPFDVSMARDRIRVSSVKYKMVQKDGVNVGYIKLTVFGENTNQEMEGAIRDLERKGAQAYVLDLRNNGGGYINAAVDVCSKFLPTGSRVVSVQERGADEMAYFSHPNLHASKPLVMLVNEYSASASEITAGAMKDLNRAKLVGNKTFGKGSVQKIFPLNDGPAMKVTTAHYHTPSGLDINKKGIEPDMKVAMAIQKLGTPEDDQFDTALKEAATEVKALPANPMANVPNLVTSASDEMRILDEQKAQGYSVGKREFVRQDDRLFEDVTLQKGSETRTLRLELSPYLQR